MDVSLNLRKLDGTSTAPAARNAVRETSTAGDEVALENSRALTRALAESPPVRADVVRRAAELVGQAAYPPPETIRKISHLLAIQMHPDE